MAEKLKISPAKGLELVLTREYIVKVRQERAVTLDTSQAKWEGSHNVTVAKSENQLGPKSCRIVGGPAVTRNWGHPAWFILSMWHNLLSPGERDFHWRSLLAKLVTSVIDFLGRWSLQEGSGPCRQHCPLIGVPGMCEKEKQSEQGCLPASSSPPLFLLPLLLELLTWIPSVMACDLETQGEINPFLPKSRLVMLYITARGGKLEREWK